MKRRNENNVDQESDGSCSSEDLLTIDISPRRTRSMKSNLKRTKRQKKNSDTLDSDFDLEKCLETVKMNNRLEYTALKNNLTVANVRNILKRVVRNEHVLAIVNLKASEEPSEEEEDDPLHQIPTLTRSKVKELQQKDRNVVWPLPVSNVLQQPSSEVAVLINQELPEDSSDEEYQPHEEENNSDDDKESATISDVESLPLTPATPVNGQSMKGDENDTNWTDDGLFKIPQLSSVEQEEQNIALRTRSKLCLSSTHIETIEKAFIPPDITSDMYNCDDIDGVWKDFLKEFTEPLPQVHEDDEDTDPEYNVQIDDIPVDKEELREDPEVTVSRRELSDLVAELFDMESIIDNTACNGLTQEQQNAICSLEVEEIANCSGNVGDKTDALIENIVTIVENEHHEENENVNINETSETIQNVQEIEVEQIDEFEQYEGTDIIITPIQRLILAQQLRQHVQLTTQHFLQVYGHPELWTLADDCKKNLNHLLSLADNNPNSMFMTQNLKEAVDLCHNWQERLSKDNNETKSIYAFVRNEIAKSRASKSSHNRYYSKFPNEVMDLVCDSEVFIYPELLPEIPFRLDLHNGGSKTFTSAEEQVIAIELSLYYKYMEDNPKLFKKGKKRIYNLQNILELMEKYLNNGRNARTLSALIRNKKHKTAKDNPIKYFFEHRKPPPTRHIILPFDQCSILTPRNQKSELLPHMWKEYVHKAHNTEVTKTKPQQCFAPKDTEITPLDKKYGILEKKNKSQNENIINQDVVKDRVIASQVMTVNPTIVSAAPSLVAIFSSTANSFSLNNNSLFFTSPLLNTSHNESYDNCMGNLSLKPSENNKNSNNSSIDKTSIQKICNCSASTPYVLNQSLSNNQQISKCECKCSCSVDSLLTGQKLLTHYFKPKASKNVNEALKTNHMNCATNDQANIPHKENISYEIILNVNKRICELFQNIFQNLYSIYKINYKQRFIKGTFVHMLTLEFFICLYFPSMLPSMPSLMTPNKQDPGVEIFHNTVEYAKLFENPHKTDQESTESNDKEPKGVIAVHAEECCDNNTDDVDTKKAKCRTPKSSGSERRKPKTQKESKIVRDMLTKQTSEDYDANYAQLYYERVLDRLNGQNSSEFEKFYNTVQSITDGEDPSAVYKNLESLFLPNHPDLLDQFLTFLLPGQAAKIGKFMEHFLINNMEKFVQKINVYFAKQPAQTRKIYTALSELSDIPNVSMTDVKSSILPLLKGNPLLIEWFLQLFPTEKPLDSNISDFERLDFDKMDPTDMTDHVVVPEDHDDPYGGDNCICKCHTSGDEKYRSRYLHCIPCGMKYIQGRVYIQTGKRLRPATVTFDGPTPMLYHIKRLSAKPKPYKRRAELSPTKLLLSPNKCSGSSSEEHRMDISTDIEDDSKKSPKKNAKICKNTQNKCNRNKHSTESKALGVRDCHVVIKGDESLSKSTACNTSSSNKTDCNTNVADSTNSLSSSCTENMIANHTANNIQVNVCDSTAQDVDSNDLKTVGKSNELQVIIPHVDLNISMESDGKVSPVSVASSDVSACSDSDVSMHSEKSDPVNSDSDSIDDIEENSNDSEAGDRFLSHEHSKCLASSKIDETLADNLSTYIKKEPLTPEKLDVQLSSDKAEKMSTEVIKKEEDSDNKIWTRNEDKIVLQTFQEECDFESTLSKICELLPHKKLADIKNRFQVLMNLLQKMSTLK